MLLTISERNTLSQLLPQIIPIRGSFLLFKTFERLQRDLVISDEDKKEVQFVNEFECPNCKAKEILPLPVKCGKCNVWLKATGKIGCSNWEFERDIPIPDDIGDVIKVALKQMNDNNPPMLEKNQMPLYEKFVGGE